MNKKVVWVIVGLAVLAVLAYLIYFKKPAREGAVGTAEELSESVPKISTNPGEDVPEINPIDRANPFKYLNPLR